MIQWVLLALVVGLVLYTPDAWPLIMFSALLLLFKGWE